MNELLIALIRVVGMMRRYNDNAGSRRSRFGASTKRSSTTSVDKQLLRSTAINDNHGRGDSALLVISRAILLVGKQSNSIKMEAMSKYEDEHDPCWRRTV